jgi:hypothetical protein
VPVTARYAAAAVALALDTKPPTVLTA